MQIALNDVLKDDGKILRVDADFGPDTFEMKLGKYPITRKTPVSLVLTNKGKAESVNTGQDGSYDSDSLRTLPGGSSGRV